MKLWSRLGAFFVRRKIDAEMSEEMRLHLEQRTAENVAAGMSPGEARAAALRRFGGVEQIKERARAQRSGAWLEHLGQDLRLGARGLAKAPAFSLVAIGTLALGIGACTAVYSVIDGLLLHPIGHDPHPEHEVILYETRLPDLTTSRVAPANFLDWQQRAKSFAFMRAGAPANLTLTGGAEPVKLVAARATQQLLETHGWPLALGRGFLPEEDQPGRDKVIILSYQIWQRILGGDPAAVGRPVQINGEPYTLVGVISEEVGRFSNADGFVPMAFSAAERGQRDTRDRGVWARLKPGVTLEQARAEMDVIAAQLAREHPDTNAGWGVSIVTTVQIQGGGGLREALWTLLGAVACVLLIACANVANLLLARATARQRELAVRAALGAGRGRLVRQLLTESLLLALLGGVAGVLLAHAGLQLVHSYAGPGMMRLGWVELNGSVLAGAVALSALTGLVFGVAPAWFASRVDLNTALKHGARGATEGGGRGKFRAALVVAEVTLAVVLLAGTGALVRRLAERARLDPGFAPDNVTVMQVNLPRPKYARSAEQAAFAEAVLAHVRALPAVQAAAATSALPVPQAGVPFAVEGAVAAENKEPPRASVFAVTPDYPAAMGLRVTRGRAFTAHDGPQAPRVVLVNELLARQFFPRGDALGHRLRIGRAEEWSEIVGVVADVTQFGAETGVTPQLYEPLAQRPAANLAFVVRTAGDPAALRASLKPQVYAVDRDQPVQFVRPLGDVLDERIAGQRFAMHLLSVFSLVALVIAAVGIYAVIAYTVSLRTTEFGIRIALGAAAWEVRRLVLGFAVRVIGCGLLAGAAAALAVGRVVEGMLYGVNPRDPLTLAAIGALLALVALGACLLPARRATKTDPMVALRAE